MSESPANRIRLGTWLSIGSPVIAELAAGVGYDWVLMDLEHGCESEAAIPSQLRALRGSATSAIVRVGAPHPDLIARVLDWGARGIMVPHVNSADMALECVEAMHYPPVGKRGISRSARVYGYGLEVPDAAPAPPVFMAQIETIEGVEHAASIAAVDGVDVLFVGPADLQFDLRARPGLIAESYEECLTHVVTIAKAAGKEAGILVRKASDLPALLAMGFTCLAMDSDLALIRNGMLLGLEKAKKAVAGQGRGE